MKKSKRKNLEEAIKNNSISHEDVLYVTKKIYVASFIRFAIFSLFLIWSILSAERISKLAIITADTVLSHEVYFSPTGYYFTCLGLLVGLEIIVGIFFYYKNHTLTTDDIKLYHKTYRIYDIGVFILEILVSINFIIMFLITPVTIEGNSMNNTFNNEDKVMIWHFLYAPEVDDVVILDANKYIDKDSSIDDENKKQEFFIKRVVAMGNDKLLIKKSPAGDNYYLYSNDKLIETNLTKTEWFNITGLDINTMRYELPEGKLLLMGDNRAHSFDGRYFGLVSEDDILGKVILRYFPFNGFGYPDKDLA